MKITNFNNKHTIVLIKSLLTLIYRIFVSKSHRINPCQFKIKINSNNYKMKINNFNNSKTLLTFI